MPSRKSKFEAIPSALGKVINNRRRELGISQDDLAMRCGIHRTYVSDIERGKRNPTLVAFSRLADGLGMSATGLMQAIEQQLD